MTSRNLPGPTGGPEKIDFEKMQKVWQLTYEVVRLLGDSSDPLPPARRVGLKVQVGRAPPGPGRPHDFRLSISGLRGSCEM